MARNPEAQPPVSYFRLSTAPAQSADANVDARMDEYHASIARDPLAQERRAALHERRLAHASLLCAQPLGSAVQTSSSAVTWASLEQCVESEVACLRALLGGGPLWSCVLGDRLRTRCTTHGLASLVEQRQINDPTIASALVGAGPLGGDTLAALTGQALGACAQGSKRAHAWVYRFSQPEVALAHMVSHPAFGVGGPSTTARTALVTVCPSAKRRGLPLVFGGSPRRRNLNGSTRPSSGDLAWRFVVVVTCWQAGTDEGMPVGMELPALADSCRRSTERADHNTLSHVLAQLRNMTDNVAAKGKTADGVAELPFLIDEILAGISNVWATVAVDDVPDEYPAAQPSSPPRPPVRLASSSSEVRGGEREPVPSARAAAAEHAPGGGEAQRHQQARRPQPKYHVQCKLTDLSPTDSGVNTPDPSPSVSSRSYVQRDWPRDPACQVAAPPN